ncbi:hypothetical protein [Hungatella hathewayi]|uniref:hypothetical protein n=1 Tax=Hungatella hathewayi TaxID=154046 RepID=UPI003565E8AA
MNILQVHSEDLLGSVFNGYRLQKSLNKRGILSKQIVQEKKGFDDKVVELKPFVYAEDCLRRLEGKLFVNNMFSLWGRQLFESKEFQESDIIHYHMIHHNLISTTELMLMADAKPSVWTIHDPWAVTGHCVHPLGCNGWKNGCRSCPYPDYWFPASQKTAEQMWGINHMNYSRLKADTRTRAFTCCR